MYVHLLAFFNETCFKNELASFHAMKIIILMYPKLI